MESSVANCLTRRFASEGPWSSADACVCVSGGRARRCGGGKSAARDGRRLRRSGIGPRHRVMRASGRSASHSQGAGTETFSIGASVSSTADALQGSRHGTALAHTCKRLRPDPATPASSEATHKVNR